MKIKFDSTLSYQQEAIDSIVNIFKGQDKCDSNFTVYSPEFLASQQNIEFNEIGFGNRLTLNDGQLLDNIQKIQLTNGLAPSTRAQINRKALDFSIEMETGTGKTYVYLRTILELYVKYGFSKHIIVVPSIPIKEGVFKSLKITKEHLRGLYDNINYNFFIYDSGRLNEVRDFATNDRLEIMVINIDAFSKSFENKDDLSKAANIIHRYNDSLGYKPLDLIRNTNPFVIIDEPQTTISTELRKESVRNLNPLAIVKYSATHREADKNNLMFKLDAVSAYERKLVKQIEVGSIEAQEVASNGVYIKLLEVKISKSNPTAKLEIDVLENKKITRKTKTVKAGDDLEIITNIPEYAGYIIRDINAQGEKYIDFLAKDDIIKLGDSIGGVDLIQIKTALIRKTIEEHLDKEVKLNPLGIKVLSLFFIDTVSKYRIYDEEGNPQNGEYAEIFEAEYKKMILKPKYNSLFKELIASSDEVSQIHNGYFSIDKKSKQSNSKEKFDYFKDTNGNTAADENTYNLIMKDKEKLLQFDSKLRFIFSHSALREGWDNPNVFQICTLKEAGGAEIRRRQEIGRGLRLCVNQNGDRVYGHEINTLTVMASESYNDFVKNFQSEMESETGIVFGHLYKNSFCKIVKNIEENEVEHFTIEESTEFYEILIQNGYLDSKGKVQDLLKNDLKNENLNIPEQYKNDEIVFNQITNLLKDTCGRLEIKNSDTKKEVKINDKIFLSAEFKELWDKIKFKTSYSVDFDSDKLISECINGIDKNLEVKKGKLIYTKAKVNINSSGVSVENEANILSTPDSLYGNHVDFLPDIITYLQNETQLTRKSIVKILTGINKKKLDYFKINPQVFIEACIIIINDVMKMHIVDGVKYHKVADNDFYKQELFKEIELSGYIDSNLISSTKSPFDFVIYDSNVESTLTEKFESEPKIPVYSKLPSWFKIETPLGTYNPDWAILWREDNDDKLYFIVESKSDLSLFGKRPKEDAKIECGKRHFSAIGAEMIVAKSKDDITDYALSNFNI
jgi:type III restriction enzyme